MSVYVFNIFSVKIFKLKKITDVVDSIRLRNKKRKTNMMKQKKVYKIMHFLYICLLQFIFSEEEFNFFIFMEDDQ